MIAGADVLLAVGGDLDSPAVGTAAAGHPVIAVCADGGLMMVLGEIATVVQERLPITVLVVDDGGYGCCATTRIAQATPRAAVTPDFPALAAAFGLRATDDVPAWE